MFKKGDEAKFNCGKQKEFEKYNGDTCEILTSEVGNDGKISYNIMVKSNKRINGMKTVKIIMDVKEENLKVL